MYYEINSSKFNSPSLFLSIFWNNNLAMFLSKGLPTDYDYIINIIDLVTHQRYKMKEIKMFKLPLDLRITKVLSRLIINPYLNLLV